MAVMRVEAVDRRRIGQRSTRRAGGALVEEEIAAVATELGMCDRTDYPARGKLRPGRRDADQVEQAAFGLVDHLDGRVSQAEVPDEGKCNAGHRADSSSTRRQRVVALRRWRHHFAMK